MIRPFGPEESLSIFSSLEDSSDCWIPHHQSDSWQSHGVCLVVGDESDGTVSGFVLCQLGGPGLPYFWSVFIPECGSGLCFTLPSSLPTLACSLPPPYTQVSRSVHLLCSHNVGVDSGPCFPLITTSSTFCTV